MLIYTLIGMNLNEDTGPFVNDSFLNLTFFYTKKHIAYELHDGRIQIETFRVLIYIVISMDMANSCVT